MRSAVFQRRVVQIFCGLMISLSLEAGSAGVTISIDLTSSSTEEGLDSAPKQLSVKLFENSVYIESDARYVYYDFDERRVYSVSRAEKSYTESSLFSSVGFRDYELHNRKFLVTVLEKSGASQDAISLVQSEHELSVTRRKDGFEIERISADGQLKFMDGKHQLLSISKDRMSIPPQLEASFLRYLRHSYGVHPSLLSELIVDSTIPVAITISHPNSNRYFKLRVSSIEKTASSSFSIDGLSRKYEVSSRLQSLSEAPRAYSAAESSERMDVTLSDARRLVADKEYVEGMLKFLEYSLSSGAQNLPLTEPERGALFSSTAVTNMLAATKNPESKEEAAALIEKLVLLRAQHSDVEHVLRIFQANTTAAMGDSTTAKKLMQEALAVNPYIVGAWKDLGEFYFRSYEPIEAWFCWDVARRINSAHPLLEPIDQMESSLLELHPGLF